MNESNWWEEFLAEPAEAGEMEDKTKELKQLLGEALRGAGIADRDDDLHLRRRAAYQLTDMANRVWRSHESAGNKRSKAHTAQRVAAGGGAAVAAGTGGALAGGLKGTTATVLGIVVIGIAVLAGIVSAVWPESEYKRNMRKARRYEKLWWDIWAFATLELPTIKPDAISGKLEAFSAAIEVVGED